MGREVERFSEYASRHESLSDGLDEVVKPLKETLLTPDIRGGQIELFSREERFDQLFDEFGNLIVKAKPLYQRWNQKVGSKYRELSVPNNPLRVFFDEFLIPYVKSMPTHERSCGGEVGWSTRKNIEIHFPSECVFSFDLENAFENVDNLDVFSLFYKLFDEVPESERINIAGFLSAISSVQYGEVRGLPQGSSLSMHLFNRILFPIDKFLDEMAKQRGMEYSRWVDDINLSSREPREVEDFLGALAFVEDSFPISSRKTYFQDSKRIYLIGHVIDSAGLRVNSRDERELNKKGLLDYKDVKSKSYSPWIL